MARELIELGRRCPKGKIWRDAYTRKSGTKVKGECVKDIGKPGETPEAKRVLPKPKSGDLACGGNDWNHKQDAATRRRILKCLVTKKLRGKPDPCRSGILNLNLLANFTKNTSPETHEKARAVMAWLRKQGWCKLKTKK